MVIVTGASGIIGANVTRALLSHGEQVRAIVYRDRRAIQGLDIEQVQADIRNPDSLCHAFAGAEIVYHLAGLISLRTENFPELESVNINGTRNVVEACLRCGVQRLVYFSSIQALQPGSGDELVDETHPLADLPSFPPYDRSKAVAEKEVRVGISRGLDAVILNPSAVVGPYDFKPSYIGRALIMLARGRIPALVHGGFDWVDARDVAAGAVQAGLRGSCGRRYILSGHWHTVREVAEMVADLTGRPAPRLMAPMWLAWQAAPLMPLLARFTPLASQGPDGREPIYTRMSLRALSSGCQISHAHASLELGYQPRPLQETLADTLQWFEKNEYLSS